MDLADFLAAHEAKSLLRFITCGSVDDGKSTLIGRLLHDCQAIADDQLSALAADSKRHGTQGDAVDLALLVDGLAAEREQGITIDVAYRFFTTAKRKFIVADTPGHEQYTRNMATGASTADLAVILVDATKGILPQTRRHSFIVAAMGIRRVVLAVNKMDAVSNNEQNYDGVVSAYRAFAENLGIAFTAIPLSGLTGANVVRKSLELQWYQGETLLEHLENVDVGAAADTDFRMPVQWVNRPKSDFRGFSGLVAEGAISPGKRIKILPSGRFSTVSRIVTADGDLPNAVAGQSVTLVLADDIDCSRGDVIADADAPPAVADQFEATLVWMDDAAMLPGRTYDFQLASARATATVTDLKRVIDTGTLEGRAAKTMALNDIGIVNLSLDRAVAFEPYDRSRALGGFILVDRLTGATAGAGMIRHALRRADNIHWQALDVNKAARAAMNGQMPCVLWFTGLSGAGKSTIANLVEKRLHALGRRTYTLDGDNVRHGLNRDLGFTDADRVENIRRVGEVAKLMVDAGLVVMTSFISPFRAERRLARDLLGPGEFIEVFVDTPIADAEARDVKGLYAKARSGALKNFTGIDSPYEAPEAAEIRVDTRVETAEDAAERIVEYVLGLGQSGEIWAGSGI